MGPHAYQTYWWTSPDRGLEKGVFQGGGARGVAYAGALKALDHERLWFDSVAGASAGAVTAALIAAGMTPDAIADETTSLLAAVAPRSLRDRTIARLFPDAPILVRFDAEGLERELVRVLAAGMTLYGIPEHRDGPTFAELHKTGIELFVVCLDASYRQPVIFDHRWTPDIPVAKAVTSSCSLPVLLDPYWSRWFPDLDNFAGYSMIVDGGAWANFPSFVFRDEAFRRSRMMGRLPADAKVYGFALQPPWGRAVPPPEDLGRNGTPLTKKARAISELMSEHNPRKSVDVLADRERQWREGTGRSLDSFERHYRSAPRRSRVLMVLSLAIVGAFASATVWAAATVWHAVSLLGRIGIMAAGIVTLAMISLAVGLTRRAVATGMPAVTSMMSQATSLVPWAGLYPGDVLIHVPDCGVETTDFRTPRDRVGDVIECARWHCLRQLQGRTDILEWLWRRRAVTLALRPGLLTRSEHSEVLSELEPEQRAKFEEDLARLSATYDEMRRERSSW